MTVNTEQVKQWSNLIRLYWQPEAAARDYTGWSQRHREAVTNPRHPFERSIVWMLTGWLLYADAHRNAYESAIGDDGFLGKEWGAIGAALRGLLNGDLKRLDGGTLDCILGDTIRANGINVEEL